MKNNLIRVLSTHFVLFVILGCVNANLDAQDSTPKDQQRVPVIVDTDMGFDDWMAVLYLLNKPGIDIVAITVDGAGETYCPQGAVNATKLLKLAKKRAVPVYFGEQPPSTLPFQFPKVIRDSATKMNVPDFNQIPGTTNFSGGAPAQLLRLALQAGEAEAPLTILSIGTSTNIAQAIELAKNAGSLSAFAEGIRMIYKGGGAVGDEVDGSLTNSNIKGNLSIPGIFSSKNTTAEWNIYANASGIGTILKAGLPVTLVPTNLSDQVKITRQSHERLKGIAKTEPAKFVVSVIEDTVASQGGWTKAELEYWDPSVVVAAVNPGSVTKEFNDVQICVDSNKGDSHGTIFIDTPDGAAIKCQEIGAVPGTVAVYTAIDTDEFYRDFFNTLNRQ
jgi:inosine-uridine nucleoside N-ribohydrolase